jgi:hypothetical protein
VRLSPAYDVVVTAAFPELDHSFALTFAGTTHPEALTPEGLRKAAREFRLSPARANEMAADVLARVERAVPEVATEVLIQGGERSVVDRVVLAVTHTAAHVRSRLFAAA